MPKTIVPLNTVSDEDAARLMSRLVRDSDTGCLLFTGSRHRTGYGSFRLQGRVAQAHRVSWTIHYGPPPWDKPYVLHTCDVRLCCEPSHLWCGTVADNAIDMAAKWRGTRSKTGLPYGAYFEKKRGCYRAMVRAGGRLHRLGDFPSWAQASAISLYFKNVVLGLTVR